MSVDTRSQSCQPITELSSIRLASNGEALGLFCYLHLTSKLQKDKRHLRLLNKWSKSGTELASLEPSHQQTRAESLTYMQPKKGSFVLKWKTCLTSLMPMQSHISKYKKTETSFLYSENRDVVATWDQVSTSLGNSGLCWTVFARNRDTAVPAEGNGDLQTLICVLVARSRRCLTLSTPVPWQNWMVAYLGYTLRMKTQFHGWPIMVHDTHTRTSRPQIRLFSA